ncbi:MAG: TetR family transcriptional regulator [Geodermatophilaceae bacterium]|nr:TetR family transcriptional regulator [Geodermatophilaceae bacterium]
MARRRVDVRREEILDAAVAEVTKRGFAQTRVGDVANALGVSTALVFYHFDSKERLLAAALDHAVGRDLDRLATAVDRPGTDTERLRRILSLYAPQGAAPGWTLWVDAWAEALRNPELRAHCRTLDRRWTDAIAATIASGVENGTFRCTDPESAARRITSLMDGLSVQATVHRRLSRAQLKTWTYEYAAVQLAVDPEALL